jgi:hypothetical protein
MNNMDVLKGTLLAGALAYSAFANSESNGIFRNGYDPVGSCPQGRATMTVVSWKYNGSGRRNIDVTLADNIWGRWDAGQTPVTPPWLNVFALFWALPRHSYVAAEFTLPDNLPLNQWGLFGHGATSGGPPIDVTISDECGDFNPPELFCALRDIPPGQNAPAWKLPGYPGIALCTLEPGGTYYINIRVSDPNVVHPDCSGAACKINVQNNHTP